jgi:multicomponent Na+:H+ antiporter subunit G
MSISDLQIAVGGFLLIVGAFALLAGSVGLLRLPDFYSRTHATGSTDTLAVVIVIAGLIVLEGATLDSAKLALVAVFVCLANPVAGHALAHAAYASSQKTGDGEET